MNMKDLLPKTFTCFKRNNMEIYDSITYVEPFSPPGVLDQIAKDRRTRLDDLAIF